MSFLFLIAALSNGIYGLVACIGWLRGKRPDNTDRTMAIIGTFTMAAVALEQAIRA